MPPEPDPPFSESDMVRAKRAPCPVSCEDAKWQRKHVVRTVFAALLTRPLIESASSIRPFEFQSRVGIAAGGLKSPLANCCLTFSGATDSSEKYTFRSLIIESGPTPCWISSFLSKASLGSGSKLEWVADLAVLFIRRHRHEFPVFRRAHTIAPRFAHERRFVCRLVTKAAIQLDFACGILEPRQQAPRIIVVALFLAGNLCCTLIDQASGQMQCVVEFEHASISFQRAKRRVPLFETVNRCRDAIVVVDSNILQSSVTGNARRVGNWKRLNFYTAVDVTRSPLNAVGLIQSARSKRSVVGATAWRKLDGIVCTRCRRRGSTTRGRHLLASSWKGMSRPAAEPNLYGNPGMSSSRAHGKPSRGYIDSSRRESPHPSYRAADSLPTASRHRRRPPLRSQHCGTLPAGHLNSTSTAEFVKLVPWRGCFLACFSPIRTCLEEGKNATVFGRDDRMPNHQDQQGQ